MRSFALPVCALMAAATGLDAHAQSWPAKPLRWISPFAPGGGADFTSRALAQKIGPALGQQIIVDNRPGSGGIIGTELVARDG